MIIATAGHVDHGKTTLVRALTGIDTDRLPEEQRRGMTIDLGFAYAEVDSTGHPGGQIGLAFVDVPGHERFVRNMLAGVAAIDVALLVVAADDGPMAQTREHLSILRLLDVPRLVVALTKIDRVSTARLAEARREVEALLVDGSEAGSRREPLTGPLSQAPVFTMATPLGTGVAALLQHLATLAAQRARRRPGGHFRMVVDRSFVVDGAGRVVTGTVLSGQVRVGDQVRLSPLDVPARVRTLQAHGRPAEFAAAGQRCALNLSGPALKQAEPARGQWVLAPDAHARSARLDVQLQLLATQARPLQSRSTLQLHLGAGVVNAHAWPLGEATMAPGGQGLAQLVLEEPVHAAWGDRFILRDPAARCTVAGGRVIDPFGVARGRSQAGRLAQLAALACEDPAESFIRLLNLASDGVDLTQFARGRNLTDEECRRLREDSGAELLATPDGPRAWTAARRQDWRERVLAALDQWHAAMPGSAGPDDAGLRRALGVPAAAVAVRAMLRATLAELVAAGLVVREGRSHRRAAHQPRLLPADQALLEQVKAQLEPAGLRPPIVGELAKQLGMPLLDLREFLGRMSGQGLLVAVAPNRWYLPQTVSALEAHALALAEESPQGGCDVATYRDRTGIGRNLTVQVLEYLDRTGITRFDGHCHRPLR